MQSFKIKVVTTQLFIYALWVFLLIRLITQFRSTPDLIVNVVTLLATVIFGYLLIRGVRNEISHGKKIEKLAQELSDANEKLRELDEQKSKLLSFASHQFRGPLTAMRGYASLILEGSYGRVTKKMKDPIERIVKASDALSLVVDDFLTLSHIERGQIDLNLSQEDFRNIVSSAVEEFEVSIEQKGLELILNNPDRPIMAQVDKSKIRQVVMNLLDNAKKYTKEGAITVTLKEIAGDKMLLSVEDTGVGISREDLDTIFKQFNRGGNVVDVGVSGSGLGLFIAREMVRAHNGRIWAESEGRDKGSIFFVELGMIEPDSATGVQNKEE